MVIRDKKNPKSAEIMVFADDAAKVENIVNTHRAFHVRGLRVHHKAGRTSVTGREQEELAVTRMLHRIVLVEMCIRDSQDELQ